MLQEPSNKGLIIGVVAVAILIFGGLTWAIISVPPDQPGIINSTASFKDDNAPSIGPENANVVVHIYSDFQCPACLAAEPTVKAVMASYKDRVRFVWKDFPLTTLHPNARQASNAARCAQDQGKFWEYHDQLYAEQSSWSAGDPTTSFKSYASRLGLNQGEFDACLDQRREDGKVMADVGEGNANGVNGTPTVFVNQTKLPGWSQAEWSSALDQALVATASPSTP